MKGNHLAVFFIMFAGIPWVIAAQTSNPSAQDRSQNARNERDLERRMQDMRALDSYSRRQSDKDRRDLEAFNPPELDKKTKERIRQMRMFETRDIERYRAFLAGEKTGIFKLFPAYNCVSANVIKIDGDCANFVPETSDFSFRAVSYTNSLYHDIGFETSGLLTDAFFSQGILTALGDVPIENVDRNTAGLKFLFDVTPESNMTGAKRSRKLFEKGINDGGFRYSTNVEPVENMTFALRMIAYRVANSLPAISGHSTMNELKFKSLDMDKRDDIIIAFRLVRKDQNGGLTIVWKELDRKEAPKIKFDKNEVPYDFK